MPTQSNLKISFLYEDNHLVVLSKPAGLLSQGEISEEDNLVDRLRVHFGRHYVGLIHRLDRNTSGLLVVAKRTKAAQRLTRALQEGKLNRAYLAWVHGKLLQKSRWEHRLEKDERTNRVRISQSSQAKLACLTAEPLGVSHWRGSPVTLVRFELETGRSHQIRVQASAEGHPLLGDTKYRDLKNYPESPPFSRTALHSAQIEFPHPMSGEYLQFEDPLPPDLSILLQTQPLPSIR